MGTEKFVFILILSLNILCIDITQAAGFGEPCNQTVDECESGRYLQCSFLHNVCECMDTLDTVYDPWREECRLLKGVECSSNFFAQSCAENSYCPDAPNPTCTCETGFEENVERQCFKSYYSQCHQPDTDPENRDPCDPAGFLKCTREGSEYFCKCTDFEDAEYYPTRRTCHLLANATCALPLDSMQCIDNAHCDIHDRKCRCDESFLNTPERRCHLGYGMSCDPWADTCNIPGHVSCHQELEKCLCSPYGESTYYPGELGCRLLEDAGCSVVEGSQRCIDNSTCIPSVGAEPRRCKCNNNLSPNRNRECYLTYGDRCDIPQDYCDPAGFLGCADNSNLCGCRNPDSFYDTLAKECRYELGAKCKPGMAEQPCGNNAGCDLVTETCRCDPNYEDAGDGNCLRSYGTTCSEMDPCNARNQLACYNASCNCIPGFLRSGFGNYEINCLPGYMQKCPYDGELQLPCAPEALFSCIGGICTCSAPGHHIPEEERCAVLAGNQCIPTPDNATNVCVTNAFCSTTGFPPGRCICQFGFQETFNGFCISGAKTSHGIKVLIVFLVGLISLKN